MGIMSKLGNFNILPDYDTFILWMKPYNCLLLNVSFGQMNIENILTNET